MKKAVSLNLLKISMQFFVLLAISLYSLGGSLSNVAYASKAADSNACGQQLAEAEAQFKATLLPDGSVPASPQAKAAAQKYILVAKLCYDEIHAGAPAGTAQDDTPIFIDDGGILLGSAEGSADFALTGGKWGSSTMGTSGGTVSFSFMGNGISLKNEPNSAGFGASVALSSLPTFSPCFITDIQSAFAAWQAVSNIRFVQVNDSGTAFGAAGATGDIRIGAHTFDGPSSILAHGYFPSANGGSGTGDIHFDSAENWSCDTRGVDIGVVALHEIGHALGLNHETTNALAVMDPYYNPSLAGLQTDDINGAAAIYGPAPLTTAPVNDNFINASSKPVNTIPYTDFEDTTAATVEASDPQVNVLCDNKLLYKGANSVWYQYTPGANITVSLDTIGSDYDTYIAVWTLNGSGNFVYAGCDDDRDADYTSQLMLNAQAGVTYYIEIAEFAGTQSNPQPPLSAGGNLFFHVNLPNINVRVHGNVVDQYYILTSNSERRTYDNVDNGPVQVMSTNGTPLISSMRINLKLGTGFLSYTEFMGLPASKLTDTYLFPWYNNANAGGLSSQLRFANVGIAPTTVTITIGGVVQPQTFLLSPNQSARVEFADLDAGPVQVKSSGGVPIIASMRINLKTGMGFSSYTEFMGLSASSTVGTKYMFPWYNNATFGGLSSQLRFGNVGNAQTTVSIKIAGVTQPQTYTLAPNQSERVTLPNVDSGPVEITSSGGVPIIAGMRVNLKPSQTYSSYTEFIGLPGVTLTETRYLFPWYNNASNGGLSSQLRFGNVGNASTTVTIKIAGVAQPQTYNLAPNASARVELSNIDNGPVEVLSSGGVPIIASMRVNLMSGTPYTSYAEFMGLSVGAPLGMPGNELSTTYWFPWYNNANNGGLSSQLRIGFP